MKRNAHVSVALRARRPWVDRPRRRASERHGGMAGGGETGRRAAKRESSGPRAAGAEAAGGRSRRVWAVGTEWCLARPSRHGHGPRASTRASRARGVSGTVLPSRGRGAACAVAGKRGTAAAERNFPRSSRSFSAES